MQLEIRSFVSVLRSPSLSRHLTEATKNAKSFEECNVFGTESVNSSLFKRGVQERGENVWQGKCKTLRQYYGAHFGKEMCKTHRQFQRYQGDVTSVSLSLSFSLYLSLSLSPSAPHAQYRKCFRASYNKKLCWREVVRALPCESSTFERSVQAKEKEWRKM